MGLRTKLNLLLLVVGAMGAVLFATVSTPYLDRLAEEEVEQSARIMMASATGMREYTSKEIAPCFLEQMHRNNKFYPQAVSAYAAVKNFGVLQAKPEFTDYSYREPALNPTNPTDGTATEWEIKIIQDFRNHPSKHESTTYQPGLNGKVMMFSVPIQAKEPCLVCHSTPGEAPKSLVAKYGDHGFGWQANEIIGAQIVSVPMKLASDRATRVLYLFLAIYLGVLVVLGAVLNAGLALIVTGPVRTMSRIAEDVSLGRSDTPEFDGRGSDEIARLGQSFTRMRRSLEQALRLLSSPHRD
jgi:HAMP domain-containing protein